MQKKKTMIRSTIYNMLILALAFTACEQNTISTYEQRTAVVQGYLFAGQPVDSIRITQAYSYADSDTTLTTLDDLMLYLSGPESSIRLSPSGAGYYQANDYSVQAGQAYLLEFDFNGETVSAETYIPEKKNVSISAETIEMQKIEPGGGGFPGGGLTQIDPIELTWDNSEGDYFYIVIDNIEVEPEYINGLFENPDLPVRRFNLRTEPQVTDFYAIDPRRQLEQFGTHRVVVYRVNPEYAALYETAGSSSLSITEPPSNVINGLGILTGVSSDTVYFEVLKK